MTTVVELANQTVVEVKEVKANTEVKVVTTVEELTMQLVLEDNRLTAEQRNIVKLIYDTAKETVETILTTANVSDVIKITQCIAAIIKLLEMVTINNAKVAGSNKKQIALELTKDLIKDIIKDEGMKANIIAMYDMVAEQTLETLIDVSRTLNVAVQNAASSCCASFFPAKQ